MQANTGQPFGLSCEERAEAVTAFDSRFAEMERVVWFLSQHSRVALLEGETSPVLEALIWTVRSWMGVQGVRSEAKELIARAIVKQEWSTDAFKAPQGIPDTAEEYAYKRVDAVVQLSISLGARRREFSLCSKVLHWLQPWRVPVYDSFVRSNLRAPASWDHPRAYRYVVRELFQAARQTEADDCQWLGPNEPASVLRGFDKCLWWAGGGSESPAVVVKDPWRIVRELT